MTAGTMLYGTNNNAGTDRTTLTSTNSEATLQLNNDTGAGLEAIGRGFGVLASVTNPASGGGFGLWGFGHIGVFGAAPSTDALPSTQAGVQGLSNAPNGNGVWGEANTGPVAYGVYGASTEGYAGRFQGKVSVTGLLLKGGGGFRIDHPRHPETKYLSHSFVESPQALNVYSGMVTTDADGGATVELPEYFEDLNEDFRYQLTVIGQFAQAIVADDVSGNQFTLRTDQPNVKVSWQVSGVRKDPFAAMNALVVEEDKPAEERGTYLHPAAYGRPESQGVDHERMQALRERPWPEGLAEDFPTGA